MIHLNDSKYDLGGQEKTDMNSIGKGYIGIKGFETFLSFDEICNLPLLLETPGDDKEHAEDIQVIKNILKKIGKLEG